MSKKEDKFLPAGPQRWEFVQAIQNAGHDNWFSKLPQEKQNRIARSQKNLRTGMTIKGPLYCFGPKKCPFSALCPLNNGFDNNGDPIFADINDYPLGLECVLESSYMRGQVIHYMEHLDVDHQDPVEMSLVKELALIDLLKQRALNILSIGDRKGDGRDFLKADVSINGISPQGDVLQTETVNVHPLYNEIDRLERRRMNLLKKLIATREDQLNATVKLGKKEETVQVNDTILELKEFLKNKSTEPSKDAKIISMDDE